MVSTAEILVGGGVAAVLAAVAGGGLKAFGVELPLLASVRRQVMLGIVGVFLIATGVWLNPPGGPSVAVQPQAAPPGESAPPAGTAADNSEPGAPVAETPDIGVADIRRRIRTRLLELESSGNVAALRQMAAAIGVSAAEGTAMQLRFLIQDRVAEASTLAETRELAIHLGVPLDDR